ncbi:MAG TPA: DUF1521 domain-containing protein [Pyrinomonadaceae bacterium]|jgi:hypothetical protein
MSVNVNIFNFNSPGIQADLFAGINPSQLSGVNDILADIFSDFAEAFDAVGNNFTGGQSIAAGGCVVPPSPFESSHPQGSLKTDGSVITTPGGYKIEATGQFEWKITGPDGKTTRVWGDPHVAEGDGGTWDFKRNSTFVLGDGTRINVSTAPYGNNGMTVTSGLEIISGNDRVTVSGIDKGMGVVGQVTADGYAHANTFGGNDVFVMGGETDDWSFQGREIVGSHNGGESFKLGDRLAAGGANNDNLWEGNFDFNQLIHNFVNDLMNDWNREWRPNRIGQNPYYNNLSSGNDLWEGGNYNRPQHQNQLRQAFRLFGELFGVLARLASLNDQMSAFRSRALYA